MHIVIPVWLLEELRKLAEAKGISLSEHIRDTLKKEVNKDAT